MIASVSSARADRCPEAFRRLLANVPVHVERRVSLDRFPHADVVFLGQGEGGGEVFRVTPVGGEAAFVFKKYDSPDRSQHDVLGLRALAIITERTTAAKQIRPVKVIEVLERGEVRLEYVPGSDFLRLAQTASPGEKTRLQRLFRRQMESLKRQIYDKPIITVDGQTFQLQSAFNEPPSYLTDGFVELNVSYKNKNPGSEPEFLTFWIKPDNVVLAKDGRIMIIDPL